jgi:uncharacterized protein YoxC
MKITLNELRNLIKSVIIEAKEETKGTAKPNPLIAKTKKMVDELNQLINEVNPMFDDSEDIHGVQDSSSSWGTSYIYQPITFNEKKGLTIISKDVYDSKKSDKDEISIENLEYDGIPTLQDIKRMYNSAKRKLEKEKMKKS